MRLPLLTPWRRFGGAATVRLPHFAPTDSPRKSSQSQYNHAKTLSHLAADSVPRLLRSPSGSPPENAQARSEPAKSDNRTAIENALAAIPTHGVTRTQNAAREPHRRADRPPRAQTPRPELKPAKRNAAPAHYSRAYDLPTAHCRVSAEQRPERKPRTMRFYRENAPYNAKKSPRNGRR